MQILRSRENPLIVPGLSLAQRLNYFASMFTYFESYRTLVYTITPAVILLTGWLPLRVVALPFLANWCTYMAFSSAANIALGRGDFRFLRVQEFNVLKMFTFIWASTLLFWPRRLSFKITPKSSGQLASDREWRPILLHLVTIASIILAIAIGMSNLFWGLTAHYSEFGVIAITILWAVANCGVITFAVSGIVGRIHRRQTYRFPALLFAEVWGPNSLPVVATTSDISEQGIGMVLTSNGNRGISDEYLRPGQTIDIKLHLPGQPLTLKAKLTRASKTLTGEQGLGARFMPMAERDRRILLRFLFVTLPRVINSEASQLYGLAAAQANDLEGIVGPPALAADVGNKR